MTTPAELEEAAITAARGAGAVLRRRFRPRERLQVESKGMHDFVTEVDREAEAAVVAFVRATFPDHTILAEEGSPSQQAGRVRWVVDPLDGTTNFIHGVPTFAVSVAVEDPSGVLAGAIYDPVHDEMFHCHRSGGARLNGEPITCTRPASLHDSLIATGFPFRELSRLSGYLTAFEAFVRTTAGLRRAGSASLDLAYTACGRYDGFFEIGLSRWDIAAGTLLVQEAGGTVTAPGGGTDYLETGDLVAAGPTLHAAMIAITSRSLRPAAPRP
ncbi:MAG TPA: inositol monophosphatase family protein [Candidatus Polarisedimenticolaceae bacterium]|nr:inositol monophosphatase family protein [Candidatus Polarisedimenticolaceae bacterium]